MRFSLIVAATLASFLMIPTGAKAGYYIDTWPACGPSPAAAQPATPDTLAWGREILPELLEDPASEGGVWESEMTFRAADPAQPISHPWGPMDSPEAEPIPFERGDGVGQLLWRWAEGPSSSAEGCVRSAFEVIEPIPGVLPSLKLRDWDGGKLNADLAECRDWLKETQVTGLPVTYKFTGAGRTKKRTVGDVCDAGRGKRSNRAGGWMLRPFDSGTVFVPKFRSRGLRSFRLRVSAVGIKPLRGRFRVKTRVSKPTRIWEGSDSFINICIGRYPLRSQNGRLYCVIPGDTTHSIRDARVLTQG